MENMQKGQDAGDKVKLEQYISVSLVDVVTDKIR